MMDFQPERKVDYLIVGQGICGTLLSYFAGLEGRSFVIIDEPARYTASKVASGIMNPVTGKKWVTTWMAPQLFPFAVKTYKAMEAMLDLPLISEYDLFSYHATAAARALFEARIAEDDTYLYEVNNERYHEDKFHFSEGIGGVSPCYVVAVQALLSRWREKIKQQYQLIEAPFSWGDCRVDADGVQYKHIRAGKLICCGGSADDHNPYFSLLPFQLNKGEAIIAAIPDLPPTHIYKQGILNMVPWQEDLFWIGSIFDREYTDELPSAAFRKKVTMALDQWLKVPYEIVGHQAALRPATGGQKPFVGLHPVHPAVGIFNGMGSKGCSQAPFLAHELIQHIIYGSTLTPEADIKRFTKILSRGH